MSTVPKRYLSPQEYLAQERLAEFRSDYFRGETFAMAGGTPRHSLITANAVRDLSLGVKGGPCATYNSDLRILVAATGLFSYPDVTVICGKLEHAALDRNTAVNPTLLVEVLSAGTEAYDRGTKFDHYRQIPTLREYLMIAQNSPALERHLRNADGTWTATIVTGLEQSLLLPSVGVTLALAEIYENVDFTSDTLHG